jgi:hypothetical protein
MQRESNKQRKQFWFFVAILLIASALTYLPLVNQIGYLNDDWYLMYDAHTQGPDFFHEVYRGDRPARAYVLGAAYSLFGDNALYYHLSGYAFRFLSGFAFFWIMERLWAGRTKMNFSAALLFLLYPGFLSQVNPIDYQSQLLSLCLAIVSIALTIKAIQTSNVTSRVVWTLLSILLGIEYLALIDYFIGLELLRLAIVFLLVLRVQGASLKQKFKQTFLHWLPFAAGPGLFLIWRLFIFETDRRATDVGAQLGQLFSSPLVGLWWLVYLVQDVFNVLLVAWGYPLYLLAFQMRLRDTLIGFSLAAFVVLLVVIGLRWGKEDEVESDAGPSSGWMREEYWLGLVTVVGGLLPVILANRHILFPDLSRYALASSAGVAILLAGIIAQITSRSLRMTLVSFLIVVSILTHFGNAVRVANETEVIRNFWWQVSWRAPGIQAGTTLVASYPGVGIQEDYFVWGPANLIYYPEKQTQRPIEIKLPAAVLTNDVVLKIITRKGAETPERRGNILTRDFGEVLFIVQTSPDSCVRIIDGDAPELSSRDSHRTMVVAPFSQLDFVRLDSNFHEPPQTIFGTEPEHDWCYYYQQAALARQQGDWVAIQMLHQQALGLGLYPNDSVEWMPFAQAYTVLGNLDELRTLKKIIIADPYLMAQTCQILTDMTARYQIDPEIQTFVQNSFCE